MDTSDDKESYERNHTSKNDKEKVTEDIAVLKLWKLSLQKHIDNIDKESDEINLIDMSDYKDSDERDHKSKNVEEIVTEYIEVFKLGKLSSNKNDDNIEE